VAGNTHRDGDEVDLRAGDHLVEIVEGEWRAELRGRLARCLLVRRADRLQFVLGQRVQRGNVRVGAPAAPSLCDRRSDDADADLRFHAASLFFGPSGYAHVSVTE
jgi:hypothetical protein